MAAVLEELELSVGAGCIGEVDDALFAPLVACEVGGVLLVLEGVVPDVLVFLSGVLVVA